MYLSLMPVGRRELATSEADVGLLQRQFAAEVAFGGVQTHFPFA